MRQSRHRACCTALQSFLFVLLSIGFIGGAGCGGEDARSGGAEGLDTLHTGQVSISVGNGDGTRPDLILISIDTLRPDHLGAYGYERDTSPSLDSLAARAAIFENAFAQSSWTLPSHMSLVTSTYPLVHQVETERRSLPAAIPTLAESLQANGYETTGFVSWIYLAAKFGFDRGFDRYDELIPPEELQDASSKHSVRAAGIVDSVLSWAAERSAARTASHETARSDPFFLFVHFFDPHMDYDPPLDDARRFDPAIRTTNSGSYETLKGYIAGLQANVPPIPGDVIDRAMDLYDAEIRYTDREVGRLLAELRRLGLLDRAILVVTSDHGEEFGEHGSMEGHQWTLYDEVLRVPLLISSPWTEAVRISEIVESIDIAPTLLRFAGVTAPPTYQGRPLQPLLEPLGGDESPSPESSIHHKREWEQRSFAELGRFVMRASLRTPEHKLIYTKDTGGKNRLGVPIEPGFELFDLQADPLELRNQYAPDDSVSQEFSERLREWAANRGALPAVAEPALTPEERERLRSVGYIGR